MTSRSFRSCLLACIASACLGLVPASSARGAEVPTDFTDEGIASDLDRPVNFDFLPDGRVLVVEQMAARIRLVHPDVPGPADTVGTVTDVRTTMVDEGLLGIAVDPRWPAFPYVYVHYTSSLSPNIKITRFTLTGDLDGTGDGRLTLDPASRRDVLADLPDDVWLHNGGTIVFGPDHRLYVALGDDGVECSAQDIHQLRGKILRLDTTPIEDGGGPAPPYSLLAVPGNPYYGDQDPRARLVWHFGLRNPWTFDFDPNDGTMAIADVGEFTWEEIDVTTESNRNFGWPLFEGPAIYYTGCSNPPLATLTPPSFAYTRDSTGAGLTVILGGICYDPPGAATAFPPEYARQVFYFDFQEGRVRRLDCTDGTCTPSAPVDGQPAPDAWATGLEYAARMRFGPDGRLWYVQGTELRRIAHVGLIGVPGDPFADGGGPALRGSPSPTSGPIAFDYRAAPGASPRIRLYSLAGRLVRTLAPGDATAPGGGRVVWDGADERGQAVSPGIYFARLDAGATHAVTRVLRVSR